MEEILADYRGSGRFDLHIRDHKVTVDQPVPGGGVDAGPTPTELFVAREKHSAATHSPRLPSSVVSPLLLLPEAGKMNTGQLTRVEVTLRGSIPVRAKGYANAKISALMHLSPTPVLRARVRLTRTHHRAVDQHVIAEATLDLNGRPVRAQVAAASSHEAIDLVRDRLRRKLSQLGKHPAGLSGRPRFRKPGYTHVPAGEREVVRHKAYQPAVATPEEAASDMELMDYDFQLFTDFISGWDAIVYRQHDGSGVAYLSDQPSLTLGAAVEALDATDRAYLFYRDVDSGRGNVLYRRHDGNYGLITPAE